MQQKETNETIWRSWMPSCKNSKND